MDPVSVHPQVAALAGDIRRTLDLLLRATEIAQGCGEKVVKISHLQQGIQEMISSPVMKAAR